MFRFKDSVSVLESSLTWSNYFSLLFELSLIEKKKTRNQWRMHDQASARLGYDCR